MSPFEPSYVFYREDSGYLACDIRLKHQGAGLSQRYAPHDLTRSQTIKELSPDHRRIIMQLAMHCSEHSNHNLLQGRYGFDLAQTMIKTGCAYWLKEKGKPLKWRPPCPATLLWTPRADKLFSRSLAIPDDPDFVFPLTPPLCVFAASAALRPVATSVPDDIAGDWITPGPPLEHQAALDYCRVLGGRHPKAILPLPLTEAKLEKQSVSPTPHLRVAAKKITSNTPPHKELIIPAVRLSFEYGSTTLLPSDWRETIVVTKGDKLVQCTRDHATEADVSARLRAIGFLPVEEISVSVPDIAKGRDWFLAPESKIDWNDLNTTIFPELSQTGWIIEHDTECPFTPIDEATWYTELETNRKGWFELEVGFRIGKRRISLLPIIHQILAQYRAHSHADMRRYLTGRQIPAALEGKGFVLIPGDRLVVIIDNLVELFDQPAGRGKTANKQGDRLRLDLWRAAEIGQLEQWSSSPWNRPAELRSLTQRLAKINSLTPIPSPPTLQTTLRPYQQWGLAWLQFLREAGFDGVLADDMGLGKTIQTLAHLLIEKEAGRLKKPCLIITPTSVIQNWVDEAKRFAPSLRILVSHGSDRKEAHAGISETDIVLTSYALLRRDAEFLQKTSFELVILDEAQYIKNRGAQTAQLACALTSTRRLCLTGTPMENHLGELWALFNFLMPGFLGSAESFRTRFRRPIEQEGKEWARQSLSRRLAPFMLRRLKSQVEKDLPAKTVSIHRVELTTVQRDLYESVRLAMQARIREEIASRGLSRSHITVLDGLLKLRQVCCDPRLVKHHANTQAHEADHSAKLQALLEMVTEMLEEGRRILIFSQFVGMLNLIEAELHKLEIKYSLLTGETKDRATAIRQFQDKETALFLISLKAGGTGLNLTAADTVIHYDPWWNPATENQATDRAHRIGQTKPVFVYRLLTMGTVEAKIQAMQERKQKLADSILSEQTADRVQFTLEDVEALFAPLDAINQHPTLNAHC
jgi:superfamily II DNA or RNA helicase